MTEQDQCARCGRPRASVLNDPLQRCRAAEAKPCLWQEIQRPSRQPEGGAQSNLGLEADELHQELELARTEAAQLRQQMESVTAELNSARGQVSQHQAVAEQAQVAHESAQTMVSRLKAEVARLVSQQAPSGPTPPGPPGPTPNPIQRFASWLATSRMALASIGSALGIALGAGGVAGWHFTNSTPRPAHATVSASTLANRIRDALPQDLRGMPLHLDDVTKKVQVDKALAASDRERATLTINAVYSGAGLRPPTIDFPPDQVAPETDRHPSVRALQARVDVALQRQGLDKVTARVEESSGPGGSKVVSVDIDANGPAQTARADSIVRSAFAGAGLPEPVLQHPVAAPHPLPPIRSPTPSSPASGPRTAASAPPTVTSASRSASGRPPLEDECYREQTPLQQFLNWKLTRCMREKCCGRPMTQNQECVAFNASHPLNCP